MTGVGRKVLDLTATFGRKLPVKNGRIEQSEWPLLIKADIQEQVIELGQNRPTRTAGMPPIADIRLH